jgi:hypothetical protein
MHVPVIHNPLLVECRHTPESRAGRTRATRSAASSWEATQKSDQSRKRCGRYSHHTVHELGPQRVAIDFRAPQINLRDAPGVVDVVQGVRVEHHK